jgi:hypothetical protein
VHRAVGGQAGQRGSAGGRVRGRGVGGQSGQVGADRGVEGVAVQAGEQRRVLVARRTVPVSPARDRTAGSYPLMDRLIAAMEVAPPSTASSIRASSGPSR